MAWGFGDDSKKKKGAFDPVDSWGSPGGAGAGADSWGWSTTPNNNGSSWAYSTGSQNKESFAYSTKPTSNFYSQTNNNQSSFYGSNPQSTSSWAFSTGNQKGHWGHQQGFGMGDSWGFGNDHQLRHMENLYSSNSWGSGGGSGSSWHFSNAQRDLDLYHGISNLQRQNESNSAFASSWGHSPTKSHFSTGSSFSTTPSSFNPFSAKKPKNWG